MSLQQSLILFLERDKPAQAQPVRVAYDHRSVQVEGLADLLNLLQLDQIALLLELGDANRGVVAGRQLDDHKDQHRDHGQHGEHEEQTFPNKRMTKGQHDQEQRHDPDQQPTDQPRDPPAATSARSRDRGGLWGRTHTGHWFDNQLLQRGYGCRIVTVERFIPEIRFDAGVSTGRVGLKAVKCLPRHVAETILDNEQLRQPFGDIDGPDLIGRVEVGLVEQRLLFVRIAFSQSLAVNPDVLEQRMIRGRRQARDLVALGRVGAAGVQPLGEARCGISAGIDPAAKGKVRVAAPPTELLPTPAPFDLEQRSSLRAEEDPQPHRFPVVDNELGRLDIGDRGQTLDHG